ncbi:MAG: hypothetical protein AAF939_10730 [Planctomycetota bacterium]
MNFKFLRLMGFLLMGLQVSDGHANDDVIAPGRELKVHGVKVRLEVDLQASDGFDVKRSRTHGWSRARETNVSLQGGFSPSGLGGTVLGGSLSVGFRHAFSEHSETSVAWGLHRSKIKGPRAGRIEVQFAVTNSDLDHGYYLEHLQINLVNSKGDVPIQLSLVNNHVWIPAGETIILRRTLTGFPTKDVENLIVQSNEGEDFSVQLVGIPFCLPPGITETEARIRENELGSITTKIRCILNDRSFTEFAFLKKSNGEANSIEDVIESLNLSSKEITLSKGETSSLLKKNVPITLHEQIDEKVPAEMLIAIDDEFVNATFAICTNWRAGLTEDMLSFCQKLKHCFLLEEDPTTTNGALKASAFISSRQIFVPKGHAVVLKSCLLGDRTNDQNVEYKLAFLNRPFRTHQHVNPNWRLKNGYVEESYYRMPPESIPDIATHGFPSWHESGKVLFETSISNIRPNQRFKAKAEDRYLTILMRPKKGRFFSSTSKSIGLIDCLIESPKFKEKKK